MKQNRYAMSSRILGLALAALLLLCMTVPALAEEPIVITAVRSLGPAGLTLPEGEDLENNNWAKYYADELNLKIDYLWTTNDSNYAQKMMIAITSNDLPDIMWVNAAQLKMLVDNGQVMDLTEVYDKYASDYTKSVYSADDGRALQSATFGGKLYGLPEMGTGLQSAQVLWIRSDWLEKLNLSAPTNMDEFYAVAQAFATQDPDGNGQADTFGMGVMKELFGSYSALQGFFNAMGAYPNIWTMNEAGEMAYGSVQLEMKDALSLLQKMYAEGLIDKEFGVKDASKVSEDVNAGRIGMFFGEFWCGAWIQDAKIANPEMEWVPVALPFATAEAKAQAPFAISRYTVVNAKAQHPEAALQILNADLEKMYGATAEPQMYSISPAGDNLGQAALIYCEPYKKNFIAAQHVIAAMETNDPTGLTDEESEYYQKNLKCLEGDYSNWHNYKMFGPEGTLTVIDGYDAAGRVMHDAFYGAPTETMSEKKSTLETLQLAEFTRIIMGDSIDSFDEFVKNWNNLGGQQMTDEANEWNKLQ